MKKWILFIAVIVSFFSCNNENDKKLLPSSNGRFNELMVIVNHKEWEGKLGIELKKVISSDVIGLPQPEPQFSITQIPHKGFDGFLKHNRNILSVERADKPSFNVSYDLYAKPQVFARIMGPDQQSVIQTIQDNEEELIRVFKKHDFEMVQRRFKQNAHKPNAINFFKDNKLGLVVPNEYSVVEDVSDFVWFRKRIEHYGHNVNGSLNIVSYTMPLNIPFESVKDSIISIRDAIGKKYMPGAIDGSYLITEVAYTPHLFDAKLDQKNAYKVQGKWEMYNDFMAGPFISYFVHDIKNNRLVVVEGLAYAPVIKKRDFVFEMESIIRSLKID